MKFNNTERVKRVGTNATIIFGGNVIATGATVKEVEQLPPSLEIPPGPMRHYTPVRGSSVRVKGNKIV